MQTYQEAYNHLKESLQPLYDEREAIAIARELMLHITRFDRADLSEKRNIPLTKRQLESYNEALPALMKGKPLQYVTGVAWFLNLEFIVNEHVLIPRPETEELVAWITKNYLKQVARIDILDIGTGSGCIPVMLSLMLPHATITSIDISEKALAVARQNEMKHQANVEFILLDFLDPTQQDTLGMYDVIVSNPPYIPLSEKDNLHINVTQYEPALALFVQADDPLVFYKAIASFGRAHLNPGGSIFCELEQTHALACKILFETAGYKNVEVKPDMHGNLRMLQCVV